MNNRIPTFDVFNINEVTGPGGIPKQMSPRALNAIIKKFQQSTYYNPKDIYNLDYGGNVRYISRGEGDKELIDIFTNGGEIPWSSKQQDILGDKLDKLWNELLSKDKKAQAMRDEYEEREKAEKEAKKQKENEARHKNEIAEAKKQLKYFRSLGIEPIFKFNKRHLWYVGINPWSVPTLNTKKTKDYAGDMKPGSYYVVSGTEYSGGRGTGLLFPSVIKYLGKTKDGKYDEVVVILSVGMHGPSRCQGVNIDESKKSEARIDEAYELKEYMNANEGAFAKVNKEYDELWNKEKDTKELPFDPYWDMN